MHRLLLALTVLCISLSVGLATGLAFPPAVPVWIDGTDRFYEQALAAADRYPLVPLSQDEMIRKGRMRADGTLAVPKAGQRTVFRTINFTAGAVEPVTATLKAVGQHCYVYLADGYTIAPETIGKIQKEFDEKIHPRVTEFLGTEWNPGIDHDPHVTLLLMDIKDGWVPGRGYIAGYFMPLDEYSDRIFSMSNEREMLYVDLFPAQPDSEGYLGIIAHEFAHLVHFWQDRRESPWLNEGLAQLASYVAGYGHPSQIFSFFAKPDEVSMGKWSSSIEDYGAGYLWWYYIYTKIVGQSETERRTFFRDLISSKKRGLESFKEVLAKHRPDVSLEPLFADWVVAAFANIPGQADGRWSFDPSMPLAAREVTTHEGLSTQVRGKGKLGEYSARSILFTPHRLWSPRRPHLSDEVTLHAGAPGNVRWTINDGAVPPEGMRPPGSQIEEGGGAVLTPLSGPDEKGRYWVVMGPFASNEVTVTEVRYTLVHEDQASPLRVIPIGRLPRDKDPDHDDPPATGQMSFEFDGASWPFGIGGRKFSLRAIVEGADGSLSVSEPALDRGNDGRFTYSTDWTRVKAVTMLAINVGNGGAGYSYRTRTADEAGNPGHSQPPADLPSGEEIRRAMGRRPVPLELPVATADSRVYQETLSRVGHDAVELKTFVDTFGRLDGVSRSRMGGFLRDLLRTVYAEINGGRLRVDPQIVANLKRLLEDVLNDPASGDDTSHSNLPYLIQKKRELIRALSHVMLDPFGLEGVLLTTLRVFRDLGRIPNIPLPEGLSIRSYNEKVASALMDSWSQGGVAPAVEDERRQVIYRLLLSEGVTEFSHNAGLVLADDMILAFYRLVTFANTARHITDILAFKAQGIPIVGALLKKIKWIIHSQILSIMARLGRYVAARLPEPYGNIVQITTQILAWGYAQAKGLALDYWDSWVIEWVVKMLGKLVLVSLPRIGYVAVGQPAIDQAVDLAGQLVHEGTLRQAQLKVGQAYPKLAGEVIRRHNLATAEIHAADILGRISDLTRIGILLDPTKITTIVSIATSVLTGAVLIHSMVVAGQYMYALPLKHLRAVVRSIYYPNAAPPETESSSAGTATYRLKAGGLRVLTTWQSAAAEALEIFERAKGSALTPEEVEREVARLAELEPALFEVTHALDSIRCGRAGAQVEAEVSPTPSADEKDLSQALSDDLVRVQGLAALALLPATGRKAGALDALSAAAAAAARLRERIGTLARDDAGTVGAPVVLIHGLAISGTGDERTLRLSVVNPLDRGLDGVEVEVETAYNVRIGPARTVDIGTLAPGQERTVELSIGLGGERNRPVTGRIVARADGRAAGELGLVVPDDR